MRKLTNKQARFVIEYQVDQNATQAAIRAGYSAKNADKLGPRLVGNSRVAEAIEREVKVRLVQVGVYAEKVLSELAKVAFAEGKDKVRALESLMKYLDLYPSEKRDDEGVPQEFNITNLELSSKLVLWVTLIVKKQKEIEEAQSKLLPNKL